MSDGFPKSDGVWVPEVQAIVQCSQYSEVWIPEVQIFALGGYFAL